MIYETYTCSMANGTIEYGFCFKQSEGDDDCCTDAEIVVGVTAVITDANSDSERAKMRARWAEYEWMAQAVALAAP